MSWNKPEYQILENVAEPNIWRTRPKSSSAYTVLAVPYIIQQECLLKFSAVNNSVLSHNQKLQIQRQRRFIRQYQISQSQPICNHALKIVDHPNFNIETTICMAFPPDSLTWSTPRIKLLPLVLLQLRSDFQMHYPNFFSSRRSQRTWYCGTIP